MNTHHTTSRFRQRGLSFLGLIFMGLLAVSIFAIGGQSLPIFLEFMAAKKAIEKAKVETTVPQIRAAFDRAAAIDEINSIKGSDLEVTKVGEKVVVSFKYAREIPLAGPAYLVYRFEAKSK